jgi:hypothetical protein
MQEAAGFPLLEGVVKLLLLLRHRRKNMLPPSKENLFYHLNIDNFSTNLKKSAEEKQTANPQFWHN